jgi:Domain of unknown function (DUF5615)
VAGRFPLYTDADIQGPVIRALRKAGWDVLRAVDAFPERTIDSVHFERAVELGRVIVTNDEGHRQRARAWYEKGRAFPGLIWWPQVDYRAKTPGDFLRAFEALAARQRPFSPYPIVYLIAKRR